MSDLRKLRTAIFIRQAFFDLVEEKGFSAVTVTEIAEKAMINRQTFYKHYYDKYDLAEKIMTEYLSEYQNVMDKGLSLVEKSDSFKVARNEITPIINEWTLHKKELKILLSIDLEGQMNFKEELSKKIQKYFRTVLPVEENSLEVYLMPTISLKMLEYVIENDRIPSEKELQQVFKQIQLLFN